MVVRLLIVVVRRVLQDQVLVGEVRLVQAIAEEVHAAIRVK